MNILKRTLAGLLVVFLAFGQVTSIPGIVDAILGASNITTAGACVYVSASGTLNQDSPGCHWDATNDRLGLGTATPSERLSIIRNEANPVSIRIGNSVGAGLITIDGSGNTNLRAETASRDIRFQGNSVTAAVMTNAGSWGFGPSNTSPTGTLHVYDATATTGVTTLTVRAGAGQSTTNLVEIKNSGGSNLLVVDSSGAPYASAFYNTAGLSQLSGYLDLYNSGLIRWSSTSLQGGSKDLGLARDAAGRLRVSDGSTGLGQIMIASSTPASAAATCAAGTVVWDSGFVYVCVAKDTWKRAAIATW